MSRLPHPLLRRKSYGYGCSCGCGTCGDAKASSYGIFAAAAAASASGFTVTTDLSSALKWDYDTSLLESCPAFKEAVRKYEKAKANYYKTPEVLGVRAGPEVAKTSGNMKRFKAEGEAAYKACLGKEEAAPPTTQALSAEDVRKAVSGGGAQQTGNETSPLVYVLGASVLAVGGFVIYSMVSKKKGAA